MTRTRLKHHWHPSPNHGPRQGDAKIRFIILHYTGMTSAEAARDWLCNPESGVSCHYLVDEEGHITQMVSEDLRAWHAGVSSWLGTTDINSHSIGIEIHNPGHELGYRDFPEPQIAAVIALCRDISERNGIAAEDVLPHSDVAPTRKMDPGEKFPWGRLHAAGLGRWAHPVPVSAGPVLKPGDRGAEVERLRRQLACLGYGVGLEGSFDEPLQAVVRAFQRHFRPERIDGLADASTLATLERLTSSLVS
jgi:N-acetylmuramoyl-L-alanine amidase